MKSHELSLKINEKIGYPRVIVREKSIGSLRIRMLTQPKRLFLKISIDPYLGVAVKSSRYD